MNRLIITIMLILILALAGCISAKNGEHQDIINDCINLCIEAKTSHKNLSKGPCLSDNNPSWMHKNWVCDVAHKPRKEIDNLPENQCEEFREGKANHFVEVNENCEVIRVW